MREIGGIVQDAGLVLAFEFNSQAEFMNSLPRARELVDGAAHAACRTGAGLTTLAGPASLNAVFSSGPPEGMTAPAVFDVFARRLPPQRSFLLACGLEAVLDYLERFAVTGKARSHIRDRLTQLAPIFLKNKYMLGDDFSMLDVAIAPLLWRLDYYGIDMSKNALPLLKYAERIFSRPAYIEALTPSEKVMRR